MTPQEGFFDGKVLAIADGATMYALVQMRAPAAKLATLERRLAYGGRKARSARRRIASSARLFSKLESHYRRQFGRDLPLLPYSPSDEDIENLRRYWGDRYGVSL